MWKEKSDASLAASFALLWLYVLSLYLPFQTFVAARGCMLKTGLHWGHKSLVRHNNVYINTALNKAERRTKIYDDDVDVFSSLTLRRSTAVPRCRRSRPCSKAAVLLPRCFDVARQQLFLKTVHSLIGNRKSQKNLQEDL